MDCVLKSQLIRLFTSKFVPSKNDLVIFFCFHSSIIKKKVKIVVEKHFDKLHHLNNTIRSIIHLWTNKQNWKVLFVWKSQ